MFPLTARQYKSIVLALLLLFVVASILMLLFNLFAPIFLITYCSSGLVLLVLTTLEKEVRKKLNAIVVEQREQLPETEKFSSNIMKKMFGMGFFQKTKQDVKKQKRLEEAMEGFLNVFKKSSYDLKFINEKSSQMLEAYEHLDKELSKLKSEEAISDSTVIQNQIPESIEFKEFRNQYDLYLNSYPNIDDLNIMTAREIELLTANYEEHHETVLAATAHLFRHYDSKLSKHQKFYTEYSKETSLAL